LLVLLALVAVAGGVIAWVVSRPAPPAKVASSAPAAPRPPSSRGPIGTASPERHGPDASGHVEGHVRDALDGAPVAGVDVIFAADGAESTATSDASGHFALDLAPGRYVVRAGAEGIYGLAPAPLALGPATRVDSYDVIVARLALVHGRVVDATGHPAPGAQVSFRTRSPRGSAGSADLDAAGLTGSTPSGADGRFDLHVLPGEVALAAERDGRRARQVLPMVGAGQTLSGVELVLDAGGGLVGVVHDPAGQPVAHAQVVAETAGAPGALFARTSATTDASGRFEIRDLPPGPARLEARASGFAPSPRTDAESRADAAGPEVVLTLRPALALRGRVVDPDGQPLEGARVLARAGGSLLDAPVARSDADGRFAFTELGVGPYDLDASAEGYGTVFKRGVAVPGEGIELRLPAVGGLAGTVSDERGGPVADFKVRWRSILLAQDGPGQGGENRFLAADGAFRLEGLSPGDYDVLVVAPGRAPAELRVTVSPGAYADASVRLVAGATLSGRVTGEGGSPVAGAEVTVMTGHEGDAIQTDADGRFALADIAPGRRSVMVEHPAYVSRSEGGIVLAPGEHHRIDVQLTPLAPGDASRPGERPVEFAGIGAGLAVHPDGVVLQMVVPGGPAERAGLTTGDLVVQINGLTVLGRTLGDIVEDIRGVVGTSVRLEVVHGGQHRLVDVVRGNVRFGG
jgi:protocatechuate 3,4-dioxygenase beta subunit